MITSLFPGRSWVRASSPEDKDHLQRSCISPTDAPSRYQKHFGLRFFQAKEAAARRRMAGGRGRGKYAMRSAPLHSPQLVFIFPFTPTGFSCCKARSKGPALRTAGPCNSVGKDSQSTPLDLAFNSTQSLSSGSSNLPMAFCSLMSSWHCRR